MTRLIPVITALLIVVAQPAALQIPQLLSYQGVPADANGVAVADGSYDITFRIYTILVSGATREQIGTPVFN
jgi:hypothetical protein